MTVIARPVLNRLTTPEDQLLVQFQGMIAEYERAQILERSRRGKGKTHIALALGLASCQKGLNQLDEVQATGQAVARDCCRPFQLVVRVLYSSRDDLFNLGSIPIETLTQTNGRFVCLGRFRH